MTIPTPPGPSNSDPQPGDQPPGSQQPGSGGPSYPPPGQPNQPYGQPSGQPSADQPAGQSSASQAQGQPSADQPHQAWNQAPGQGFGQQPQQGQPGQQGHPGQTGYQGQQGHPGQAGYQGQPGQQWGQQASHGQPPYGQPKKPITDANPLKAAFDFSFGSYATPGLVKIIYLLAVIVGAIAWIGGAIAYFVLGAAAESATSMYDSSGGGAGPVVAGILQLIFGWIPVLLWLLFVRVVLEAAMALVRAAEDVRAIRTKSDA